MNRKSGMKYLIGNWKSNKTIEEAREWIGVVKGAKLPRQPNLEVVLCPSFIHLSLFREVYPEMRLGLQTISPFPLGAYTGAVAAGMVFDLVRYVIVGHSERRRYFHESEAEVAAQAAEAVEEKLTPIISIDRDNWRRQLTLVKREALKQSLVMYEPPGAISEPVGTIGEGEAATLEEVEKMADRIREEFSFKALVYGGSVKSHNLVTFLGSAKIDGVLSGSASLNAQEWVRMWRRAIEVSG